LRRKITFCCIFGHYNASNLTVPGSIGIGIEDFSVKKENLSSVTNVLSGAYKKV
jgi:hypothetical protein